MKFILILLVLVSVVSAELPFFASHFGDHMVLQREPYRAKVWGWVASGQSVVCKIKNQILNTTSDNTGKWVVNLAPVAAGGPYTLTCTCKGVSKTLNDVLFGDVFLCGGQSNMRMSVKGVNNATALMAEANTLPNIRLFTVGPGTWSDTPLVNLATVLQPWSVASAASVGNDPWTYFSAVCYMTGRNIHVDVHSKTVPVGLISDNYGGTYINTWYRGSFDCKDDFNKTFNPPNRPSVLWNAMINPVAGTTLSGIFYYQGETDVDAHHENGPRFYMCAFPQLIKQWRTAFGREDIPFMYVQLAAYTLNADNLLGEMRISQAVALSTPQTCMATAIDQGDAYSPYTSIHPRNKTLVAARLTNCARKLVYKNMSVDVVAPNGIRATNYNTDATQVLVKFDKPVKMIDAPSCPVNTTYCATWSYVGHDGVWKPVPKVVLISSTDVLLSAPERMQGVSYLVADWPLPTIFGTNGLPASPFGLAVV